MSGHTSGRWFVERGSLRVLSDDPRATIVAEVTGSRSNQQALADARLIAAAPEMLEALREMLATHPAAYRPVSTIDNRTDNAVRNARSAIARATGQEDKP